MAKYTQKVIHLELDGKHYYFGSLKALCDMFGKETIGITYDSLRHAKLSPEIPYTNKKCTIREGILITTPKNSQDKPVDEP